MRMAVRDMDLYWTAEGRMAKGVAADKSRDNQVLRWFDELRQPLRRYLLCSGASVEDAEDAVQETFLELHRRVEAGAEFPNVTGWVFQVARNYLRDEKRSARHRLTVALEQASANNRGPADPRQSPERCALEAERARRIRAAIESLPEQQRECMLLRASGLRYREIAEVLRIQVSSVGALVHRAIARLSEDLS